MSDTFPDNQDPSRAPDSAVHFEDAPQATFNENSSSTPDQYPQDASQHHQDALTQENNGQSDENAIVIAMRSSLEQIDSSPVSRSVSSALPQGSATASPSPVSLYPQAPSPIREQVLQNSSGAQELSRTSPPGSLQAPHVPPDYHQAQGPAFLPVTGAPTGLAQAPRQISQNHAQTAPAASLPVISAPTGIAQARRPYPPDEFIQAAAPTVHPQAPRHIYQKYALATPAAALPVISAPTGIAQAPRSYPPDQFIQAAAPTVRPQAPQYFYQNQPQVNTVAVSNISKEALQGSNQDKSSPAYNAYSDEVKQAAANTKRRGNRLSPVSHVRHNLAIVSTTIFVTDDERRLANLMVGNPMMNIAKVVTRLAGFNDDLADKIDERDALIRQLHATQAQMLTDQDVELNEAITETRMEYAEQEEDLAARDRKIAALEAFIGGQNQRVRDAVTARDVYHANVRRQYEEYRNLVRPQQARQQFSPDPRPTREASGYSPVQDFGHADVGGEQAFGNVQGEEVDGYGQYGDATQGYNMNQNRPDQDWNTQIEPPRFNLNTQHQRQNFGNQNTMTGQHVMMQQGHGMEGQQGFGDQSTMGRQRAMVQQQDYGMGGQQVFHDQTTMNGQQALMQQQGYGMGGNQGFGNHGSMNSQEAAMKQKQQGRGRGTPQQSYTPEEARRLEIVARYRSEQKQLQADPFYSQPTPPAQFILGSTHTPERQQGMSHSNYSTQTPSRLPSSSRASHTTSTKRRRHSTDREVKPESGKKGKISLADHKIVVREKYNLKKEREKITEMQRQQREQEDGYKRSF